MADRRSVEGLLSSRLALGLDLPLQQPTRARAQTAASTSTTVT
jgi:hypothetical protein